MTNLRFLPIRFATTCTLVSVLSSVAGAAELKLGWQEMAPIPDAIGLGGAFGGVSGGALIVAGGSNFPEKMPWEGGMKVWRKDVFVLEAPKGRWKTGYELPVELGYGTSASVREGLVLAGGSNAQGHLTNVYVLTWKRGSLGIKELPPLPLPLANTCGASVGRCVYVAGGIDSPSATHTQKRFLQLDMSRLEQGWKELSAWPGAARMLANAAVLDGTFYIMGGTDLHPDAQGKPVRKYLRDGYCFNPRQGWKRIADMPYPIVAGPSPAPKVGKNQFVLIGGDDGSLVDFEPKSKHPGFPKRMLVYDALADRWSVPAAEAPVARATLPVAYWKGLHVLISGEAKPGIRSPQVWSFQTKSPES